MRLTKRLIFSLIASVSYFLCSIFLKIVPCQTAPSVPNPIYKGSMCTLNPDLSSGGIQKLYFGFTSRLTEAYLISLISVFIIVFIVLSIAIKRSKKKDEN